MSIHVLPANQPARRFYRGGGRIARFRHRPDDDGYVPEDWIASTSTVFGESALGLTTFDDGSTLADAIDREPTRWLGSRHVEHWGHDSKLLVKLLDAGQRLPVHAHPDGAFAQQHLLRPHGKAEAWHILEGGEVFLGLKEDVSLAALAHLVEHQHTSDLLSLLHRRTVRPGDTVFVPPGVLHAIGQDVFLAEVQEPEDLSILLEWRDFAIDGARNGHLGLGFETALQAVERTGMSADRLEGLIAPAAAGPVAALPAEAESFFRLRRRALRRGDVIAAGFAVLIVVDGAGELVRTDATVRVQAGDTVLLEHSGGPVQVDGAFEIVELRPPVPLGSDEIAKPAFKKKALR